LTSSIPSLERNAQTYVFFKEAVTINEQRSAAENRW
jgi:hypothetical protein